MPTVLQEDGFDVMIYTHDHEPKHVHVFRAEGEITINLEDLSVRSSYEMKGKDARRAQEIVAENRDFLLGECDRINPIP